MLVVGKLIREYNKVGNVNVKIEFVLIVSAGVSCDFNLSFR